MTLQLLFLLFFFFNDTATTEIYTLSLHDALPICQQRVHLIEQLADRGAVLALDRLRHQGRRGGGNGDRKSTRLNSSHLVISYAVFCLKKKKNNYTPIHINSTTESS